MSSTERIALAPFVALLRAGEVVACPTETLIGLLADALSAEAVDKVVALKHRAALDPIAVLLPDAAAVALVARPLSARARMLALRHWPGPLTIVSWARDGLPEPLVRDGKIGMRVPGASVALDLVRVFAGPLTATSANRSGEPPARTVADVRASLGADLGEDAIVPADAPGGAASTVVDVTTDPPTIVRAGAIDPVWE